MTQEFQDISGLGGFDYLTAGTQPSEKGVAPAQRNTLRTYPLYEPDKNGISRVRRDIGGFEITLNDFSQQGANHPEGVFSLNSNGYAWSEMYTRSPNELVPGFGMPGGATIGITTGDKVGLHHAFVFDTLFLGWANGSSTSLAKETSSTDPTPTAVTYNPSAVICSLAKTLDTGAERLLVGRIGSAAQLLSDATGTVAATMHTSTSSCWGVIVSGVNSTTPGTPVLLMYCGTTIGTKATDASMTTAITVTQSGLNSGGFAIGAVTPAGRAQRAYWAIPRKTTTAGALKTGAEVMMDIWSTNMEGTDLLPFTSYYLPNGIRGAVPYRDGMAYFDDTHLVYWDGEHEYDLGLLRRRVISSLSNTLQTSSVLNSDLRWRIRAIRAVGTQLIALTEQLDFAGGITRQAFLDVYNFEAGSWHNLTENLTTIATGTTLSFSLCGRNGMPYSPNTQSAYTLDTADAASRWSARSFYLPRDGESALWQNSQGTGTSTTGLPTYAQNSELLGPRWWLDGLKRNPKVITEVEFGGNLDVGGAGNWTLQVVVYGYGQNGTTQYAAYDKTFSQGKAAADYVKKNTGAVNVYDIQVYLVAAGPSSPHQIPQFLPITIRGVYSKTHELVKTQQLAGVL